MIRVTFLGTAAARPTVGRNVSSISIQREGESMLFDCGEGTQRQMMRYGTGFSLDRIFFTHLHADHFLGIVGLLRTMGLQGRTKAIHLFGPRRSSEILRQAVNLGVERISFPVFIEELDPGDEVSREAFDVVAYPADHGPHALGYVLREHPRPGRFDVEEARSLGVPEGPLFGRLHAGEPVEVDGRTVRPDQVVGPPRPGRTVVYSGDTRASDATVEVAEDTELLIHDATFTQEEEERARETLHATARQAGEVASRAGAKRLMLTHVSARYADNPRILEQEAREVFPGAVVASDGDVVEIPYHDSGSE